MIIGTGTGTETGTETETGIGSGEYRFPDTLYKRAELWETRWKFGEKELGDRELEN